MVEVDAKSGATYPEQRIQAEGANLKLTVPNPSGVNQVWVTDITEGAGKVALPGYSDGRLPSEDNWMVTRTHRMANSTPSSSG